MRDSGKYHQQQRNELPQESAPGHPDLCPEIGAIPSERFESFPCNKMFCELNICIR
jgi:hypothetical protein